MTREPNGKLAFTRRELAIAGTLLTIAASAVTFAFTAGAQSQKLRTELEGKADRQTVEQIAQDVAAIKRDIKTLVCRSYPADTRCDQ